MPADVHGRLRRLLFLVPFVQRNPGITVDALAKALNVKREALLEELDLLTMVGRPPFQPDDFIDIYVEDDKVFVDLDQRFSAPPRLTAAEGVALAAAAELLRPAATDALTKALEKLEKVLPKDARERYRAMSRQLDVALEAPTGLASLSQAIVEHREVELDYFTSSRNQTELRRVQPHELFSHRGQWYLQGHCLTRGDVRLFRLDRIKSLKLLETRFDAKTNPSTGSGRAPSEPLLPAARGRASESVTVRFNASAAPYVAERFGEQAKWLEGGVLEVQVPGDSDRWLTQWVLSFGGDATVVAPARAREAVAKAAAALGV
jgi:proteasome accessory factor C